MIDPNGGVDEGLLTATNEDGFITLTVDDRDLEVDMAQHVDWVDAGNFSRTSDATYTVSDTTTNQRIHVEGRPIRYRSTGGTWRYGIIQDATAAAGTITVTHGGYGMSTSDDDELYYADMDRAAMFYFKVPGTFADASETQLLLNDAETPCTWPYGTGYCVRLAVLVKTDDTGANQPRVNVRDGAGGAVFSANTNAGIEVSDSSWQYTTTGIQSENYEFSMDETIELSTDANGSNNDADTLWAQVTFVVA